MFVDYVYLTLIFDALSLITDIQPSTVLHISCIIFIEKKTHIVQNLRCSKHVFSFKHISIYCIKLDMPHHDVCFICKKRMTVIGMPSLDSHGKSRIYVYWLCANSLIELLILIIINSVMREWFSKGVWSLKTVTVLWSHGHNLTVIKLCRCQCTRKM